MTKNDTWPGGVAMESLSNMDSAGSCESVISMNSGYSEDSMEHLSAEERACLMYLEQTIEALEVQEDSGFSNDEPDAGFQADRIGQTNVHDISSIRHFPDHEPPSHPVSAALPSSLNLMTPPTGSQIPPSDPQPEALCVTTDGNGNPKIVTSSELLQGQSNGASAKDLVLIPPPSDFMDRPRPHVHPLSRDLAPSARTSSNKPRGNIDLEQLRQRATAKRTSGSFSMTQESPDMPQPEGYPGLSPPDVTSSPQMSPHPDAAGPQMSPPPDAAGPHMSSPPDAAGPHMSSPPNPAGPHMIPPPDPAGPHMIPPPDAAGAHMSSPPDAAGPHMSPPHDAVGPHLSPLPDAVEPRSPPAVAPKPKKLPPNIILKSHKASASDGNSGHYVASSSDRVLDPVRFEALRKLGLLKGDEADPGPTLSPRLSPKSRSSWGGPPSPHKQHFTPSNTYVHSSPPVSVPLVSPAAVPPSVQVPDILPAPDAFCDSLGPLTSDNGPSAAVGVSEADVHAQEKTPPPTPLKLTPPRIVGVKSATLERSGLGLSSSFKSEGSSEDGDLSPRQLRNSRPRPASLGSGKEFSSTQGEVVTHQEPEYRRSLQVPRRSLPAPTTYQHSRDSQKLPRSQGISVLICPRSENEEDRRQALKKLGLLRD
ncbi:specifically androgen-regulated gene protein isoform X1 [Hippoglossus hippoglossus]|uniref:specifically androgen-regulated gene protein isoform X1 n=2 Tax=Hippoglossus hippoglossus TaxID=8267 RepID=UPI00148CA007|nr:specifically androgen-regulated gene protein isoform X1 [Hippoglossus hippoglossus]